MIRSSLSAIKESKCVQTLSGCFPIPRPLHQPASTGEEKEQKTLDSEQCKGRDQKAPGEGGVWREGDRKRIASRIQCINKSCLFIQLHLIFLNRFHDPQLALYFSCFKTLHVVHLCRHLNIPYCIHNHFKSGISHPLASQVMFVFCMKGLNYCHLSTKTKQLKMAAWE